MKFVCLSICLMHKKTTPIEKYDFYSGPGKHSENPVDLESQDLSGFLMAFLRILRKKKTAVMLGKFLTLCDTAVTCRTCSPSTPCIIFWSTNDTLVLSLVP